MAMSEEAGSEGSGEITNNEHGQEVMDLHYNRSEHSCPPPSPIAPAHGSRNIRPCFADAIAETGSQVDVLGGDVCPEVSAEADVGV
eukprot:632272-Hanusia_phi.AAC.1